MTEETYMREAIAEAQAAQRALGDVPVGAVVVRRRRRSSDAATTAARVDADPTAHAEIIAIREAARAVGGWRLVGATLYVTQEPCPMCAGAIVNARVERLVYGCDNPKAGAVRTLYRLVEDERLNHRVEGRARRAGRRVRRAPDALLSAACEQAVSNHLERWQSPVDCA